MTAGCIRTILAVLFLCVLARCAGTAQAAEHVQLICSGYSIVSEKRITFNINEKRLICGDSRTDAWSHIPVNQAKFHIKTFLEERGYFFPEFKPQESGALQVIAGKQTRIQSLKVEGDPPKIFNVKRRRHVKGEVLTPKKMSDLTAWARMELRSNGYPCPHVTAEAYPETGALHLIVHPGPFQKLAHVIEGPVKGLDEDVLRRHDAFDVGETYDVRYLNLTALRTQEEGTVQSTYFTTECLPGGATAHQKSIPGKPRLIVVGFGANTEEYGIVKASWKNVRLGETGSLIDVSSYASFRKQEVTVDYKWYLLPEPSRWFLRPTLTIRREDEPQYEYVSADLKVLPGMTWDNQDLGFELFFGPALNYTRTFEGANPGFTRFVSLNTEFDLMSHDFEYYQTDPREGFALRFDSSLNHSSVLSDASVQQFRLSGQSLWNIMGFDPPLLILGVRGGLGTSIADRGSPDFNKLPPEFFYYLGGSQNLRGFGRKELGRALTMAFIGIEARLGHVLPLNIEPFFFGDAGLLGAGSLKFDAPVYTSPGMGLRWLSPFGVFRATVAHGFALGEAREDHSHWQFYFSFGEEF